MRFLLCMKICFLIIGNSLISSVSASEGFETDGLVNLFSSSQVNFEERVDIATGSLSLSHTDINIPGKGGFSLSINRRYSTPAWYDFADTKKLYENKPVLGLGWQINFGYITFKDSKLIRDNGKPDISACRFDSNYIEHAENPSIIQNPRFVGPTGNSEYLLSSLSDDYSFLTKSGWRGGCYGAAGFIMYDPSGNEYIYNKKLAAPVHSPIESHVYALTKITDKFGNYTSISYRNTTKLEIDSISTSDGRKIDFTYQSKYSQSTKSYQSTLTSISANGTTVYYEYDNNRMLKSVKLNGRTLFSYNYFLFSNRFNNVGNYLLDKVTTEAGGVFSYTYDMETNIGSATPYHMVQSRNVGGALPSATTSYAVEGYQTGWRSTKSVIAYDDNRCTRSVFYTYLGTYGQLSSTAIWREGKQASIKYYGSKDCSSNLLKTTGQGFTAHKVTNQAMHKGHHMMEDYSAVSRRYDKAVTSSSSVTLDEVKYITTYSDFTTFGTPKKIIEESIDLTTNTTIAKRTTIKAIAEPPIDKGLEVLRAKTVYDENNAIVSSASYTYDANRSLTEKVVNGIKTTFTYYDDGNLKTATDAENKTITYSSYYRGKAQRITDSVGAIVKSFDYFGNLTLEKHDGYTPTQYEYEDFDRLTKVDRPNGYDVTYDYNSTYYKATFGDYVAKYDVDGLNRVVLTSETDTVNNNTRYRNVEYDKYGQTVFSSIPSSSATETIGTANEYDAIGRVTRLVTPTGDLSYEYLSGGIIKYTNARGYDYEYTVVGYGEPDYSNFVRMEHPSSSGTIVTRIEKDVVGRQLKVLQGSGNGSDKEITYTYDSTYADLIKSIAQPDLTFNFTYYKNGLQKTKKVNSGAATAYTYDARNRQTFINYPSDVNDVTFTYYTNDLMKSAVNGDGDWGFTYDANGLAISKTLMVDGNVYTTSLTYTNHSYLDTMTYGGITVSYAPTAFGEATKAGGYTTNVKHHTIGSLKSFTYGNGLTYSLALHSNKVAIGSIEAKNGSTSVISKTYDYDEHGNAISIVDNLNASNTISVFSYDGADRLEKATSGMWGGEVSFTYDHLGNIKTKTRPDKVMTYNYDTDNRLESTSTQGIGEGGFVLIGVGGVLSPIPFGVQDSEQGFVYDDAGNVILNGNHTLAYNSANQLAGAFTSGTNGHTYKYDAFGKRVQVTDQNGNSTYEIYDAGDRMLMRVDPDGKRTRKIYMGNKLIASDKEGTREYIHFDTLGSTIAISNSSKALTIENYFPFGERVNNVSANNDQWYTGKKFDDFTQLSYHGARFYDPAIGRFYSHDPLDYRGMHSFNRYAYGNNNPFRYTDPNGLDSAETINSNSDKRWAAAQKLGLVSNMNGVRVRSVNAGSSGRGHGATAWKNYDYAITDKQREMAATGDREGFWKSRWEDSHDPMGLIGLKAVRNNGGLLDYFFGGQAINNRLEAYDKVFGTGTLNLEEVGIKLMNAHVAWTDSDKLGVRGLLSPRQIATYHHDVFAEYGLPSTTFGGTPITGSLWEASATASVWCTGCDLN